MRILMAACAALFLYSGTAVAQRYCASPNSVSMVYADDCPYCHAALRFFRSEGIPVHIRDIGSLMNARFYGLPGTPVIWVGGHQLIGFNENTAREINALLCIN